MTDTQFAQFMNILKEIKNSLDKQMKMGYTTYNASVTDTTLSRDD